MRAACAAPRAAAKGVGSATLGKTGDVSLFPPPPPLLLLLPFFFFFLPLTLRQI